MDTSRSRHWRFSCSMPARYFHASLSLDRALSPACRSSHPTPVIKISAIPKFRSTWICSGSRFETLKAYGIIKIDGGSQINATPSLKMALSRSALLNLMVRVVDIHGPIGVAYSLPKTLGTAGDLSETQAHPKKSARRALSTAKDIRSFTEMLLKRLPDALDTNPAKVAFGIVKIVLQIKDVGRYSSHHRLANYGCQEVKGNIDAVDQRILSTVDQLRTVEKALAGWQPNNPEEKRGIELYKM